MVRLDFAQINDTLQTYKLSRWLLDF